MEMTHDSMVSQPHRNRSALPLHEKVDLLNRIKELPPGTTNVKMCEIFGIPKSTLSRIIKSEAKIRENFRKCRYFRRYTPCKDPDVDDMLKEWFYAARTRGLEITKPVLKTKADELAQKLGRTEFSATDGWLSRWQVRHNVSFKRGHETLKVDMPSVQDWFTKTLPMFMSEFEPDNIYHAAETGLFYRAAPDSEFHFSCEKSESRRAMEQVTVLVCSNMTGENKRKLLLIGDNEAPACFSGLDIDRLPVTYKWSESAMMTPEIFEEWLSEWDARLGKENCKILLLVEMCSAHPPVTTLRNIRLEFLPPSKGSIAHPLHQGVLKKLKTLYRLEILGLVQSYIEFHLLQEPVEGPMDISSRITLLDAVQFLAKSWRAVGESVVSSAFKKAGFDVPGEKECVSAEQNGDDLEYKLVTLGIPKLKNWEEFNDIDDALQCREESNLGEDLVMAVVEAKKRHLLEHSTQVEEAGACGIKESTETDAIDKDTEQMLNAWLDNKATSDDHHKGGEATLTDNAGHRLFQFDEAVPVVTPTEAKQSLALLQRFCTQQGLNDSICFLLDKLQDELNHFCFQEKKNGVR